MGRPNKLQTDSYLQAIVAMTAIAIGAVTAIVIARPGGGAVEPILLILASVSPTTVALLAFIKARETHILINSRMDELLRSEKASSLAEGVRQERDRVAEAETEDEA